MLGPRWSRGSLRKVAAISVFWSGETKMELPTDKLRLVHLTRGCGRGGTGAMWDDEADDKQVPLDSASPRGTASVPFPAKVPLQG